jgi:hypothetical protein
MEEQRKATESLYMELYLKLQEAEDTLIQSKLNAAEARGKPTEHMKKLTQELEISIVKSKLWETFKAISRKQSKESKESEATEELYIKKYSEKLLKMLELENDLEKEEANIQGKWEKANKDIEASKNLVAESSEEDQQKEKSQTRLDELTAKKNAIDQKKRALLMERLIVTMEMNQARQMKLELLRDTSIKSTKRRKNELKALDIRIKEVRDLKLRYMNEATLANRNIIRFTRQHNRKKLRKAQEDLDIVKSKEKDIDSMLVTMLEDREFLISRLERLAELDSNEKMKKIKEVVNEETRTLEKDFQEIRGNKAQDTEDTLSKKAQKAIITQGAIAGMNNLTQSIASAKVSREKILKFIAVSDEKIKSLEEGPKLEETKKTRKMMIVRQLNADQEQRERIKELRNIREYLENHTTTKLSDNEALNKDFDQILQDSADFTKTYIKSKEIVPNLRDKGTEALGRLVAEDFETNTIEKINILFDQALLISWKSFSSLSASCLNFSNSLSLPS